MPTILSHPAVALALAPWYRELGRHWGIVGTGMLLALAPDFDVVALRFGISYAHVLGHRGLSHSIPFALVVGLVAALTATRRVPLPMSSLWGYFALCMASHGLLDALTDGGPGVALLAPFSQQRFFFSWRPIEVSPLDLERFLSARGSAVLESELWWVWLPCAGLGLAGLLWRRLRSRRVAAMLRGNNSQNHRHE